MTETNRDSGSTSQHQQLVFGINSPPVQNNDDTWYQGNLDIIFPLLIIGAGLFQFILRKWIFPVSSDIISKLEDQLPSQGLIYMPGFGIFLILTGLILLVIFNI